MDSRHKSALFLSCKLLRSVSFKADGMRLVTVPDAFAVDSMTSVIEVPALDVNATRSAIVADGLPSLNNMKFVIIVPAASSSDGIIGQGTARLAVHHEQIWTSGHLNSFGQSRRNPLDR
ncbi:hypothetical protein CHS0354_035604 [Potamilus streckersoni]|uniref:Uncharacterized protein n=1 Tax=Potamilus streckersoni TaxID=2493646 RepID=A0AAE0RRY1_9BIVA|nr:hypothetical protein CHS0354_035604 [Potamilus streckersoni]